jgi:NCS1 family nucleobase:cation symporter-1
LLTYPQGYLQIKDLYSARKRSPYYYNFGFNWRAYTAYIAGILINIVGFVGAIGVEVPIGAQYIYNLNFFCGFIVASGTYYLLCRLSPVPATSDVWMEVGDEIIDPSLAYEGSDFDEEGGVSAKGEVTEETAVGKDLQNF